ncbi:MAG: hypothetical protein ACPGOY_12295 [Rhodospirillaceae bacterium]
MAHAWAKGRSVLAILLVGVTLAGCKSLSWTNNDRAAPAHAWTRAGLAEGQAVDDVRLRADYRSCSRWAEDEALTGAGAVQDQGFVIPGQGDPFTQNQYQYARKDKARYTSQCMRSMGYVPKSGGS